MSEERSVYFSGKTTRIWIGRGLLGVLAGVTLLAAAGGHGSPRDPQRARDVAPPDVRAVPALSSAVFPAATPDRAVDVARSVATAPAPRAQPAPGEARSVEGKTAAPRARLADPRERERLLNVAHRELEALELQEPKYFLTVFDMMRDEDHWDERTLEAGRRESHRYILARMNVLSEMLRRFIDDPESDHSLEVDRLAELDDEFKAKIETLSRDVPALANVQDLLTSTILKAPAFTDQSPETE